MRTRWELETPLGIDQDWPEPCVYCIQCIYTVCGVCPQYTQYTVYSVCTLFVVYVHSIPCILYTVYIHCLWCMSTVYTVYCTQCIYNVCGVCPQYTLYTVYSVCTLFVVYVHSIHYIMYTVYIHCLWCMSTINVAVSHVCEGFPAENANFIWFWQALGMLQQYQAVGHWLRRRSKHLLETALSGEKWTEHTCWVGQRVHILGWPENTCWVGQRIHVGLAGEYICVGLARTVYIRFIYDILAGISSNIRSCAVYIYGSGQP